MLSSFLCFEAVKIIRLRSLPPFKNGNTAPKVRLLSTVAKPLQKLLLVYSALCTPNYAVMSSFVPLKASTWHTPSEVHSWRVTKGALGTLGNLTLLWRKLNHPSHLRRWHTSAEVRLYQHSSIQSWAVSHVDRGFYWSGFKISFSKFILFSKRQLYSFYVCYR